MVNRSQSTARLMMAKISIQKVMEGAKKSTDNQFFRSKYADLNEVMETIKDAMNTAGVWLLIEQYPDINYDIAITKKTFFKAINEAIDVTVPCVTVITRITHVDSGEFEEFDTTAYPAEDTPQAIGSTITYMRRYALMPCFGITPEDDDGNRASGNDSGSRPRSETTTSSAGRSRESSQSQSSGTRQRSSSQSSSSSRPKTDEKKEEKKTEQREPGSDESLPSGVTGNGPLFDDAGNIIETNDGTAKSRPISDTERNRMGIINKEQYDVLTAELKKSKITGEQWKKWIKQFYNIETASLIPTEQYNSILGTVKSNPQSIIECLAF